MGLIIGVAVLALVLVRQLQARPLTSGLWLVLVLGLLGLGETLAYLYGGQQVARFVKGQQHQLTSVVPDPRGILIAVIGSVLLAALFAAVRAPTYRLWRQGGQAWRQGTALTLVLWLVSLGVHLLYDTVAVHGKDGAEFGTATLDLYFAVSLGVQRLILFARARRLRDAGPARAG